MELNIPIDNTSEELKESVNIYNNSLNSNGKDLQALKSPSLKYIFGFYSKLLLRE